MPSRKASNHTKTAATCIGDIIDSAIVTGLADPIHAGGVNSIVKGEQSWNTSTSDGYGEAVVEATSPAPTAPTPPTTNGAIEMDNIVARVIITLLLIPVFVALIADAIRLDGIAAPILGR